MDRRGRRRWPGPILVALLLTLVFSTVEVVIRADLADVALASVAADDKDKKDKDKKNRGEDGDEDHVARGQVLEINTLKDPPELVLAGKDGNMVVKVLKTDEIAIHGVRLGDHLKLDGEKIHELLFEATMIEIEERCRC